MTIRRTSLQETLADNIGARAQRTGDYATSIAGLSLFRRDAPAPPAICMIEPSIVLVTQGAKQLWLGGEAYGYDASRFLITSLDLPAQFSREYGRLFGTPPKRDIAALRGQGHLT
ncbi:AraC-type transcriptional regulator [Pseudomonas sp. SJZ085]|nr:AraC-type transcriptional regulator [Pseudomonas sp. SJZ074]TWC21176.1 AraC-type transcriptional regulator [Pseudomonas sp. SJZ075]TWC33953.1 AraC-type transcriptional regulator [Pseudomonas sp. SJZ085]TWC36656.1 AraC-type transcriptional regulator [Pseudomonas sp. SJZ078]TWC57415.1 AraC-type transcriptional regulator [Pseudomonas sp. SJZ124]TWC92288.1 AraC-type transcriptional regulator [Pseudomonas sp. SJZ101]